MSSTTMQNLADAVGLSTATVSRVLDERERGKVSPATTLRVMEAVDRLGYRSNALARSLATGRTRVVSVQATKADTAYYARVLAALQDEATTHGYHLLISKLPDTGPRDERTIPLSRWPADGELIIDGGPRNDVPDTDVASTTATSPGLGGKAVVSLGVYCLPGVDQVRLDVAVAVAEAFKHLREQGRKRVAYLVDQATFRHTAEPMLREYRRFCKQRQSEYFIIAADASAAAADAAIRTAFDGVPEAVRPDALFTHSDLMATVALSSLRDLGLRVPRDVSVVGCGGSDGAAYLRPALSTIEFPVAEMCNLGWGLLARRMANPQASPRSHVLPATFRPRASSQPKASKSPKKKS